MKANLGLRPPAARRSLSFRRTNARLFAMLLLTALAMCLALGIPASPKAKYRSWEAKDWTQWTWEDCISVLNYSPWSHLEGVSSIGPSGSIFTLVQLRSALPVRQALLRELQIHKHYDNMDPQKRREFDEHNSEQLNEEAKDNVVVLIDHDSDDNDQQYSLKPDPPTQIALSIDGGTLLLPVQTKKVDYPPTKIEWGAHYNQFEYIFPRTVDGKPLLAPSNLFLAVFPGAPLIVDRKTGIAKQQDFQASHGVYSFHLSDLMYKGKLEY